MLDPVPTPDPPKSLQTEIPLRNPEAEGVLSVSPQRGQAALSPEAPSGRRFEAESQNLSVEQYKQEKLLLSVLFSVKVNASFSLM